MGNRIFFDEFSKQLRRIYGVMLCYIQPKSVIMISLCRTIQRNPNDRFGLNDAVNCLFRSA